MFALGLENLIAIHVGEGAAAPYRVPTPAALRDLLRAAIAARRETVDRQ